MLGFLGFSRDSKEVPIGILIGIVIPSILTQPIEFPYDDLGLGSEEAMGSWITSRNQMKYQILKFLGAMHYSWLVAWFYEENSIYEIISKETEDFSNWDYPLTLGELMGACERLLITLEMLGLRPWSNYPLRFLYV